MKHKATGNEQLINQSLRWWYINGIYPEIMKMSSAHMTAMQRDGQEIDEDVEIVVKGGTAFAVTADQEEHVLMPSHQITPGRRHLENFWLSRNKEDVLSVEAAQNAQEPVRLYAHGNGAEGTIVERDITSLLQIGENRYIATDTTGEPYVVFQEEDPVRARVTMKNLG